MHEIFQAKIQTTFDSRRRFQKKTRALKPSILTQPWRSPSISRQPWRSQFRNTVLLYAQVCQCYKQQIQEGDQAASSSEACKEQAFSAPSLTSFLTKTGPWEDNYLEFWVLRVHKGFVNPPSGSSGHTLVSALVLHWPLESQKWSATTGTWRFQHVS